MADAAFTDLPGTIQNVIISGHVISYEKHHVIPTTVFENSDFLKDLQARGLWDQNNFKTNGVALASEIDSQLASISPNRDVVGGALHTGGHPNYNTGVGKVIGRFETEYQALLQKPGITSTELNNFLDTNASKVHALTGALKIELSDPDGTLKVHGTDKGRIDLSSGEVWK
jgi:A nuclease family of the HNH/ENDO VII superfamily with conserved AHH